MTMVLSGSGTITGLNPGGLPSAAITYASIQAVSAGKVLGKDTSGAGTVQELPIAIDSSGNITTSGNITMSGQTGSVVSPLSFKFSQDYSNGATAASMKLFFYNNGATDIYGIGVGGNSDIQYHAGGVPTNNNGKHRFFVNNTEAVQVDPSSNLKFNSGYGSVATAYGVRAWVNWNGVSGASIRGSGNVSSVTRNGTGDYTINFATALPDANYGATGTSCGRITTDMSWNTSIKGTATTGATLKTTTQLEVQTGSMANGGVSDIAEINYTILR